MADNSLLPTASGNETFANDDIGGVKHPRAKVGWGPDGTFNDTDIATGKPLPVQLRSPTGTDLVGTAGTGSAAVLTVQGNASGTAIPVSMASVPSHAVTNAGTFATQENGAALTALQLLDDNITAQGTALGSTKTGLAGASVTTSAPTYTTGQISPLSMDTSGALRVTGAGGGTQYTEDAAAATDPVGNMLMAVRRDTLSTSEVSADGDNIALKATNKGKLHVAAELRLGDTVADTGAGTGGSATQRVILDTSNQNANGQATMANSAPVVLASDQSSVPTTPAGGVAHDGADSGNPIKIGARARSSEIAAVANNDRSDLITDLVGKLITLPYANPENFVSGAITTAMTGTTSTSLVAAPGSGLRNYITQITVSNSHATVGTDINIQDGSGGTVLYVIPAAAAYGGAVITFPTPLRQPTANTALFCVNVTTGSSTKVSASGYKGA